MSRVLSKITDARYEENYFIVASHILETIIGGDTSYIIAREARDGIVSFYSISDSYKTK